MSPTNRRAVVLLSTCALALTGCGVDSGSSSSADPDSTITVISHDSWNGDEDLITQFEEESGYTVQFDLGGDAGQVTNKLVLDKDNPAGDVVFGIDNTFASRAVDEGVLESYTPADLPDSAAEFALDGEGGDLLTPVDFGDVCINIDDTWFAERGSAPPATLDDLTKPEYAGLTVAPGAATSSPGLAFLLATIAKYGDGWQDYWSALMGNGLKLTQGWSDAYSVDFSAGEGAGPRPIVVSYSSSPPFTVPEGGAEPTTSALLDTCFRQVEYAGVIKGADNPEGAQAFIDFLVGADFQASLPESMYVYPIDTAVALPEKWAAFAPPATNPLTLSQEEIAANRDTWLKEWSDITAG